MDRELLQEKIFYEAAYFAQYPDALAAVKSGQFAHGRDHWDRVGKAHGYESRWVIPADIDEDTYLLHYPEVAIAIRNRTDPEVTTAASHFRRYGNRSGFFFFESRVIEKVVHQKVRGSHNGSPKIVFNRPLNVTLVTPALGVGGVETWVKALVGLHDPDRVRWTILLHREDSALSPDMTRFVADAGGRVVALGEPREGMAETVDWFSSREAADQEVIPDTDVLIAWGIATDTLGETLQRHDGPIIAVAHGSCEFTVRSTAETILQGANSIVAVSREAARIMGTVAHAKVILNGVDLPRLIPTESRSEIRKSWGFHDLGWLNRDNRYVGFIGRFATEKNPLAAARAVSMLPENFRCVMIGDVANRHQYIQEAERLVGKDRLRVRPFVNNVPEQLNALDVLVFASRQEGYGLLAVEAMGVGCPVVSTRTGVIPELEEQHGPLIFPVEKFPTHAELAVAVRDAAEARHSERVRRARRVVWDTMGEEKMVAEWEDHIVKVFCDFRQQKPKVSIVVPAWNEETRIEKSLRSIRSQTYQDYEVIIVDDCSSDNTAAVVQEFIKDWDGAKLICRHEPSSRNGPAEALNTGFHYVRGEFSTWWSADCWMDPRFLESLVPVLEEHPEAAMVYADNVDIRKGKTEILRVRDDAHEDIIEGNGLGSCWLWRTHTKDLVGDYVPIASEDRDMHIRMSNYGPFIRVPRVLGTWIGHGDNVTSRLIEPNDAMQSRALRAKHKIRKTIRET